jgi:hypothetical protein
MKKTSWWMVVAVLIVTPVLYVASFGPACWLYTKVEQPPWAGTALTTVYAPIYLLFDFAPEPVYKPIARYGDWWIRLAAG